MMLENAILFGLNWPDAILEDCCEHIHSTGPQSENECLLCNVYKKTAAMKGFNASSIHICKHPINTKGILLETGLLLL